MNFFEHQYKARRKTTLLVAYFVIAVVLIVVAINAALYVVFMFSAPELDVEVPTVSQWLERRYWLWVSVAVLVVITLGTVLRFIKLSGGGKAVADMVGARRIEMASKDADERRLINVVEEVSIASGTPVPVLYVMDDESAINAFVAGYRVNEAVLVVTKGTLATLSREELQGVIGHEYSHILNGDMRLNVRLMATLAGILLVGQIGGFLLRSLRYSGRSKRDGQAAIVAIGLALFIIGYVGLFFGRLIKAGVSRQREFLADASSVQFTRNPEGIAGALYKIQQHASTSRLESSHAEDMSHMCFGESLKLGLTSLLSTHPPLDVRIKTVDPGFFARNVSVSRPAEGTPPPAPSTMPAAAMGFAAGAGEAMDATSEQLTESIGNPRPEHFEYAKTLHTTIPPELLDAAHEPDTARAVVYALILVTTGPEVMDVAFALIKAHEGDETENRVKTLRDLVAALGTKGRLPLLDIVMPALKQLPVDVRKRFLGTAKALIKADKRFTLFEFAMSIILTEHLSENAEHADRIKYRKAEQVMNEIRLLLTVLARAGASSDEEAADAFAKVMAYFTQAKIPPTPKSDLKPARLKAALEKLARLSPLVKRSLITACADCVISDGKVTPAEAELLRAISLTLDCPMPPLIPAAA